MKFEIEIFVAIYTSLSQMSAPIKINVLLVGDSGVGKSTYINRFMIGEFLTEHYPTLTPKNNMVINWTSLGKVQINVVDLPANTIDADGIFDVAIILFDNTRNSTYQSVESYYHQLLVKYPNIYVVICGNKIDIKTPKAVSNEEKRLYVSKGLKYYDISAKSNYNFEKPFLSIIRNFTGNPEAHYVEGPAKLPPEASFGF
jgi:GTP-binding nuclear protein Ran